MDTSILKIGLVDDHTLFRKGIISLLQIACTRPVDIIFEASDGLKLQELLPSSNIPDLIIMDINMPNMDGFESVLWLKENYPQIPILVLTMMEKEESVIKMLQLGIRGYLCKDIEPKELGEAINCVSNGGYYYTDFITGKLIDSLQQVNKESKSKPVLNDREIEFLRLASSEYTYQEIASIMHLSPKTIDGYRKALFEKLDIKNRVGLALYAVKQEIVKL